MAGDFEIVRDGPSAYLVRVGGRDQSHVHLDDPTRLEFDYVRRMADVVDGHGSPGEPLRCVHVGGGGLSLPRYVAATRPRSGQIVLEPAADLTEAVRERLPLPARSGIKVRPVDGRSGLAALRADSADVVLLDAFDEGVVPADLVTVECFREVARVLAADGLFLLNLTDRAPFAHVRRVVAGLRTLFPRLLLSAEPATLRARRTGNLLVVASPRSVPLAALRERAVRSALPYRVLDEAAISSSFGGGSALHD
ncbi:fused MFS/spermidine synthase [Nocardioides sp.]|uniref:spermidine synthase n=1 Tax=Nocardioides sp. TaxID=35761 RepID=UPI0031FEAA97|nr:putative spermidine synthase [Nocardioides sp.]